jgi:hypothetical protein
MGYSAFPTFSLPLSRASQHAVGCTPQGCRNFLYLTFCVRPPSPHVKDKDDCMATQRIAGSLTHYFSSISAFGAEILILVSDPIGGQTLGSDMSAPNGTPHPVGTRQLCTGGIPSTISAIMRANLCTGSAWPGGWNSPGIPTGWGYIGPCGCGPIILPRPLPPRPRHPWLSGGGAAGWLNCILIGGGAAPLSGGGGGPTDSESGGSGFPRVHSRGQPFLVQAWGP